MLLSPNVLVMIKNKWNKLEKVNCVISGFSYKYIFFKLAY